MAAVPFVCVQAVPNHLETSSERRERERSRERAGKAGEETEKEEEMNGKKKR